MSWLKYEAGTKLELQLELPIPNKFTSTTLLVINIEALLGLVDFFEKIAKLTSEALP